MVETQHDPVIDGLIGDAVLGIDPKRLGDMLHMTQSDVADLAGVHRTTLARNPGSPEVQAKLGPIATILSRASDIGGGPAKSVIWFRHQPIAPFGYKRAIDIVQGGEAGEVLRWLDALEDGTYV
jgi:uncharacterized protein (DUF2384 family)